MANFFVMSSLDNAFTIGKVAFGETDYLELSGYFSVILGISLAIYFQLFRSTQIIEEDVQSSPVKVVLASPVKVLIKSTPTKNMTIVEGKLEKFAARNHFPTQS